MNFKIFSLIAALTLLFLSACTEEDRQEIQNNIENELFEDRDYSYLIKFPTTANSACPDWQPNQTVVLRESMTLPANCSFEQVTIKIDRPNVTLDCNQAVFNGMKKLKRNRYGEEYTADEAPARYGIVIQGSQNAAERISNVTIRQCQILNYEDAMTIKIPLPKDTLLALREGSMPESQIQAIAPTTISVLNSKLVNSHLHGIFVNRYISGLTVKHTQILGSGNSGIYLGADVENSEITNSVFEGNGFSSYDREKLRRNGRRTEGAMREGIAIDSSSNNYIANNIFRKNGDGGIYLYKNCWEFVEDPYTSPHRYGSNNNIIDNNQFFNEIVGVWVAERADRDLTGFTCGDPLVYQRDDERYYRDIARNNQITNNYFQDNENGIRVQDDGTTVTDNKFQNTKTGPDIKVYSFVREKIGDPVNNTTLRGNILSKPSNISFEHNAN
ncbi:MAG: right-handed parallel beta-helix repeat-containing protein [Thiolinea sp.]